MEGMMMTETMTQTTECLVLSTTDGRVIERLGDRPGAGTSDLITQRVADRLAPHEGFALRLTASGIKTLLVDFWRTVQDPARTHAPPKPTAESVRRHNETYPDHRMSLGIALRAWGEQVKEHPGYLYPVHDVSIGYRDGTPYLVSSATDAIGRLDDPDLLRVAQRAAQVSAYPEGQRRQGRMDEDIEREIAEISKLMVIDTAADEEVAR